jgi:CheY-like chemotaxis protein
VLVINVADYRETEKSQEGFRTRRDREGSVRIESRKAFRLLERFFSRHGYHVLVASDGEEAIELYCRYKVQIDAVLLDARLPKTTGEVEG